MGCKRKRKNRLTKAYGKLMNMCDEITVLDPAKEDNMEKNKGEVQDKHEGMIEWILAALWTINLPAIAPATAPIGAGGRGNVNSSKLADTLKLHVITVDHNLVKFKAWAHKFRVFYRTSKMANLEV